MERSFKPYLGGVVGAGVAYGLVSFGSIEMALIVVGALAGFAFVSAEIVGNACDNIVDLLDRDGLLDSVKRRPLK